MLTRGQIDEFWRDGYLLAENAVSGEQLRSLQESIREWVPDGGSRLASRSPVFAVQGQASASSNEQP